MTKEDTSNTTTAFAIRNSSQCHLTSNLQLESIHDGEDLYHEIFIIYKIIKQIVDLEIKLFFRI